MCMHLTPYVSPVYLQVVAALDLDQSRGGLTLQQIHEQLHTAEKEMYAKWDFDATTPSAEALYKYLFEDKEHILEWNRIGAFQVRPHQPWMAP